MFAPVVLQRRASVAFGAVGSALAALAVWAATAGTAGFMPHGHCYLWTPALVWLHVGSDALIGSAYVAISATLAVLVYRARERLPFSWMMLLFGAFIIACGATHFVEIWTVWTPSYWLAAWVKVLTALVSVGTAILLPPLVPKALALADEAALSAEREQARSLAVAALQETQAGLERRVEERTRALSDTNAALAAEVLARERAQAAEARQAGRIRALYELAAAGGSPGDQLAAALRLGCEWFDMAAGCIQRLDVDVFTTSCAWSTGGDPVTDQSFAIARAYGPMTARVGGLVALHDVAASPDADSPAHRDRHMASYVGMPLMVNGELYGTLDLTRPAPHAPFEPADLECIRLLSRWVTAVIERQEAERIIAEARDRALEASRLKSEFVSTMSHELRTPLNIILGYADLIADGARLEPEDTRALECIQRSGLDLLALINDTLDVARLEAGRVEVVVGTVDLPELFARLDRELHPMAATAVRLRWTVEGPPTLETDGGKLHTVLKNLAGNALKFTAAGEVAVTCRPGPQGGTCFDVRDTGIGIPAGQLPVIFDMFRQVDGSSTRSYEGVGLGLYIVRSLVDLLGGTIAVQSTVGAGTTFSLQIPDLGIAGAVQAAAG